MAVLLAAATVAAIDLAAKEVSEVRLADSTIDLGLMQLQLAYNSGVAFSMGDKLPAGMIVTITAAICVLLSVHTHGGRTRQSSACQTLSPCQWQKSPLGDHLRRLGSS